MPSSTSTRIIRVRCPSHAPGTIHPLKEAREALLHHGAHFLFSTLTIDTISARVRRLVQAFLRTCVSYPVLDVEYTWREEARFAAPPPRVGDVSSLRSCLHFTRLWGRCHSRAHPMGYVLYVGWSSELCTHFFSHSRLPVILTILPYY